jgi:hypothetical protein
LRPKDANPRFGTSVDVDGELVIVGGAGDPLQDSPGFVYIFRGRGRWKEVARLASPLPAHGMGWGFGRTVGISGESAIVGELDGTDSVAWILGRYVGGKDRWGIARRFPDTGSLKEVLGNAPVDIHGNTAVFGRGDWSPTVYIFDRHTGGPEAWGLQAMYETPSAFASGASSVSIRGDYVVFGAPTMNGVHMLARNQGGPNAWGVVTMLFDSRHAGGVRAGPLGGRVSIDGDTALLSSARQPGSPQETSTIVMVSDVDGDGLRDGVDSCPRDPLNNVAGGCQRKSGQYPEQYPAPGDLIVQETLTTDTHGKQFIITTTFRNTSQSWAVKNPFFEVTKLTGQNVLINGDAGPGGIGSTLSPDVGDGTLSPGESMAVEFIIRLSRRDPFEFQVVFRGEPVS